MARTELILIFLLQFTAGISGDHDLYYRVGNDVSLPCDKVPPFEQSCSSIKWLHGRNQASRVTLKAINGKINQNLPGADRLSLNRNCFLIINNITADDAGHYTCRIGNTNVFDTLVPLNILTISSSPPDADPKTDDEVTLKCSLLRYNERRPCPQNSIRWVNENRSVLLGEGDGYKFKGQTGCDSLLTVKHQSDHNRRYTCQFIQGNTVKTDAHYTPVFKEETSDNNNNNDNDNNNSNNYYNDNVVDDNNNINNDNNTIIIVVGVVVGMLVVLVVIAAVLIKCRRRAKVTEDVQKLTQVQDEPGTNLTYVTINHANHNPKKKVKVKEEAVTYSTIKTSVKMEADSDPSSFYSSVR